jgi:predicted deacylase
MPQINSQLALYTNSFGQEVFIPIIRYSKGAGSKIILTCLAHGDEVIGSMAALQLLQKVKEDSNWQGELVILPCLNQAGMERVSRFFEADNLYDTSTQNLNRLYGADNKSLAGQVANTILNFIINEKPNLVIDCHSYAIKSLVHIILDRPGGKQEKQLIDLAQQSQIPFYLEYEATTVVEQKLDFCLPNQLLIRGLLALTVELGPQFGFDQQELDLATQALSNLVLGTDHDLFDNQNANDLKGKIVHRQEVKNQSSFCGLFIPLKKLGQNIKQGETIAEIYNLYGELVSTVTMPTDGIILVWSKSNYTYPQSTICVIVV